MITRVYVSLLLGLLLSYPQIGVSWCLCKSNAQRCQQVMNRVPTWGEAGSDAIGGTLRHFFAKLSALFCVVCLRYNRGRLLSGNAALPGVLPTLASLSLR